MLSCSNRTCGALLCTALLGTCVFTLPAFAEPPFAKEIKVFLDRDRQSPPEEGCLLFVGSSSIRLWPLEKSFPEWTPINRGFGGSQMSDLLHWMDHIVLAYRPRTIVLYEGDNDIQSGKSSNTVVEEFQEFVRRVHARLPETQIIFMGIKSCPARWDKIKTVRDANQRIAKICADHDRLVMIDTDTPMLDAEGRPQKELFVEDGLHLNAQGYQIWTTLLRKQSTFPFAANSP